MMQSPDPNPIPLRHVHSEALAGLLQRLGSCLAVTTYQASALWAIAVIPGDRQDDDDRRLSWMSSSF